SSDSQTWGRNDRPHRSRSAYSRRTCRASAERSRASRRSQKRSRSSSSSVKRAHGHARRKAEADARVRVADAERPAARFSGIGAWRTFQVEEAESELTQVPAVCLRGGSQCGSGPLACKPEQRVREQPIGAAFQHLPLQKAVAPQGWYGAGGVMS